MPPEWTKIYADLTSITFPLREMQKLPDLPPEREEFLNLTWKKGTKLKDKITGEEVTVIGGTRAYYYLRLP